MRTTSIAVAACMAGLVLGNRADAQVTHVTYYSSPAPVTTYYAPAPAVPVTTYYAPAPTVPVTTYYAPAAVPVTTYYAPAPVVRYQPAPVATTRYRPFLGGSVTRVRSAYRPVIVNPVPVVYGY
jgi:hypothetical protein